MMYCRILLVIPFLICFYGGTKAQVTAMAAADTNRILIGEPINLNLTVRYPKEYSLEWPLIQEEFQMFELIDQSSINRSSEGNINIEQKSVTITSFDTGWHVVEPFIFLYSNNNNWDSVKTEPILVHIATVAVDTTQEIKPLKGILEVERTWLDYINYIIAVLVILILLGLIWWWYKKRKVKEAPAAAPEKEKVPVSVWANQQLDILESQYKADQITVKTFYIQLSEVLRKYLLEITGIDTLEMTTNETINALKRTAFNRKATDLLLQILSTADMAKFAKSEPADNINLEMLDLSREVILLTKENTTLEHNDRI